MATDYRTQPDHVEADRVVEMNIAFHLFGSPGHVEAVVKRVQRYLSVELGCEVEVLAHASRLPEICGAWGGCPLPKGHNMGKADIPANHRLPVVAGHRRVGGPDGLHWEERG